MRPPKPNGAAVVVLDCLPGPIDYVANGVVERVLADRAFGLVKRVLDEMMERTEHL
jgi:hypothetical protein